MADQSLNSATHHCLGRPLPHQLANAPRAHPKVTAYAAFQTWIMRFMLLSGISTCFQVVSQSLGQIAHVLLTHPPLASNKSSRRNLWIRLDRLACIRHAASVRPEPGSNSQFENWALFNLLQIICLRIDFAYLFGSNIVWPAHCETLFSFQSTNLRLSDATFYILLACRLLVNKFLIFIFILLQALGSLKTNNTLPSFYPFVKLVILFGLLCEHTA